MYLLTLLCQRDYNRYLQHMSYGEFFVYQLSWKTSTHYLVIVFEYRVVSVRTVMLNSLFLWLTKKQYQRRFLNLFHCLSNIMFFSYNSKFCTSYFQNIYVSKDNSSEEPQQLSLTTERHNSTMSVLEAGKNCNSLHVTKCYK